MKVCALCHFSGRLDGLIISRLFGSIGNGDQERWRRSGGGGAWAISRVSTLSLIARSGLGYGYVWVGVKSSRIWIGVLGGEPSPYVAD